MPNSHVLEFENTLNRLIGLECWNVMAGAVGSMASLDFGAKVARNKPLPYPNVKLSPEEHKFQGELVLYIEDCPWRLDSPDEVLASWTDSNAPRGPIVTELKKLVGTRIIHVEVAHPGLDLLLRFDSGVALRIFPDISERDDGDNYSLSVANGATYIVGARSQIRAE